MKAPGPCKHSIQKGSSSTLPFSRGDVRAVSCPPLHWILESVGQAGIPELSLPARVPPSWETLELTANRGLLGSRGGPWQTRAGRARRRAARPGPALEHLPCARPAGGHRSNCELGACPAVPPARPFPPPPPPPPPPTPPSKLSQLLVSGSGPRLSRCLRSCLSVGLPVVLWLPPTRPPRSAGPSLTWASCNPADGQRSHPWEPSTNHENPGPGDPKGRGGRREPLPSSNGMYWQRVHQPPHHTHSGKQGWLLFDPPTPCQLLVT